jgi:hypothetical protein
VSRSSLQVKRGGDEGLREIFRGDASFVEVIAM